MTTIDTGTELTDEAPVGRAIGTIAGRRTPTEVPVSRYVSPEWADLEMQRMWPRVWQLACSVDHVPEPGDYFEYELGPFSILIVRGDDGELRGFQNSCRHRGNVLCTGSGSGLSEIRCIYHRWSWTLDGKLREVPSRKGFGALRNDDYPLIPVALDTWGPLVFVNLDADAEPLDEFLEIIPELTEWADVDRFVCEADVTVPLPCNWKTLIEAFCETYHVQGIHREMLASVDDVNSVNRLYGRHGSLFQPYGIPSPRLRDGASDQEVWESIIVTQGARYGQNSEDPGPVPPIPESGTMRDLLQRLLLERAGGEGRDLTHLTQSQQLDLFQFSLFPNTSVIVMCDRITCLRARPGATPDDAFMDIVSFNRLPDGEERAANRPLQLTLPADDARINLVFDQDISNLLRAQRGLHQPGLTHLALSREEMRIINLHCNLDDWCGTTDIAPAARAEIDELRAAGRAEHAPTGLEPVG